MEVVAFTNQRTRERVFINPALVTMFEADHKGSTIYFTETHFVQVTEDVEDVAEIIFPIKS